MSADCHQLSPGKLVVSANVAQQAVQALKLRSTVLNISKQKARVSTKHAVSTKEEIM